jgi:predicted ATP-dependent serine protease
MAGNGHVSDLLAVHTGVLHPTSLRRRKPMKTGHAASQTPGIEGFDQITRGGLPRGRTSVVVAGPGSGKTVLALQTLVNGARREVGNPDLCFSSRPEPDQEQP